MKWPGLTDFFTHVLTVVLLFLNYSLGRLSVVWSDIFPQPSRINPLPNDRMSLHRYRWVSDKCTELAVNFLLLQPSVDVCYLQLPVWFGFCPLVFVLLSHNSQELS